jgi:4-alpha-glucanotransferase
MGDIPFGVSANSAEVWAQPELFLTGWSGGTPPDRIFKHDEFVQKWGQNWGIPLYDWPAMRRDDFRWWRGRVRGVREFFDLFRIDHVLGFYRIYGFPWRPEENDAFLPLDDALASARTGGPLPGFQPRPDDTEENRAQNRLDGETYLRVILQEAGPGSVIGEDLGEVPEYVRPSLMALGIAGYKIPQWEKQSDGRLIPGADYPRLSLATYGTHDHEPLRAQWERLAANAPHDPEAARELSALCGFAGLADEPSAAAFTDHVHEALLRALFACNSWIAVAMITDVFGRAERFNSPGVASLANWSQRMHLPVAALDSDLAVNRVQELIESCGRGL